MDLMRNAPVEARGKRARSCSAASASVPRLPWYRGRGGRADGGREPRRCAAWSRRSCCRRRLQPRPGLPLRLRPARPHLVSLRPHARRRSGHLAGGPCPDGPVRPQAYPHHDYLFEPQSRQYLDPRRPVGPSLPEGAGRRPSAMFLPLTLEMGSWRWVKKSPRQMFSLLGMFNPLPQHRLQRVLRRHLVWLDFLTRAARGLAQLAAGRRGARSRHHQAALAALVPVARRA
ncbi:MAG: hypothetical protein MZW92_63690 [Comamonadaceae bacterium]|nr:hypothetical protein [Comamonadaceae bacterium]